MSSEKFKGLSSTRYHMMGPMPQNPEYKAIGILHEHRDNNDVFNFPPFPVVRGCGSIDPQEGSKTKHMADPFNIGVEQNNRQINQGYDGYGISHPYFHQTDDRHKAAAAFTQVPTSQKGSLDRLNRYHQPQTIDRHVRARNPGYRPRTDDEREKF
jgi:hypothetical protein